MCYSFIDFPFYPSLHVPLPSLLSFPSIIHSSIHQLPINPSTHPSSPLYEVSIYPPIILPSSIHQSSSYSPIIHLSITRSPIHQISLYPTIYLPTLLPVYQCTHPPSIHPPILHPSPSHPLTHPPLTYHPSIYPVPLFASDQPLVPTLTKNKACQLPQQLSLPC